MTIHVTCECGKQLHAPDEFAGRQTRCPTCQRPVMLPHAEAAIQPVPATPPMPAMAYPGVEMAGASPSELPIGGPGPATSKLALWSLVLGLISVVVPCLLSIPAIILGILSLRQIGRNPRTLAGKGIAVTGLVAGSLTIVMGLLLLLILPMLLLPAVQRAREAAARITSVNNLKQIGLACHIHHDSFQYFPTENMAPGLPNGSKLSWRVQILPFIEAGGLYGEFHHDEAWDSPHNKKLLPRMPKLYLDPRFQTEADREKGLTYYRGFVGPGGILGNSPAGASMTAIRNANSMSNTLLVVEAGEPVAWTKPEDPSFDENGPFGGPKRVPFAAVFVDGHVQILQPNIDRPLMRKLINWQNTEPVQLP